MFDLDDSMMRSFILCRKIAKREYYPQPGTSNLDPPCLLCSLHLHVCKNIKDTHIDDGNAYPVSSQHLLVSSPDKMAPVDNILSSDASLSRLRRANLRSICVRHLVS
jgi:hypothetical protein